MSRLDYDQIAASYDGARRIADEGLADWRAAIARHLPSKQKLTLLDHTTEIDRQPRTH